MEKEELLKLKEKIRQKCIADVYAIDRVLLLTGNNVKRGSGDKQGSLPGVSVPGNSRHKNPTSVLRNILESFTERFTVNELIGEYEKKKPSDMKAVRPRYVALFLNRMKKKGKVEQVQSGRGKASEWAYVP